MSFMFTLVYLQTQENTIGNLLLPQGGEKGAPVALRISETLFKTQGQLKSRPC